MRQTLAHVPSEKHASDNNACSSEKHASDITHVPSEKYVPDYNAYFSKKYASNNNTDMYHFSMHVSKETSVH